MTTTSRILVVIASITLASVLLVRPIPAQDAQNTGDDQAREKQSQSKESEEAQRPEQDEPL